MQRDDDDLGTRAFLCEEVRYGLGIVEVEFPVQQIEHRVVVPGLRGIRQGQLHRDGSLPLQVRRWNPVLDAGRLLSAHG